MPRHLQRELEKLKMNLLNLGGAVEETLRKAIASLNERDPQLAEEVFAEDDMIDQMEVDNEEEGLKLLALYQPVAVDLRLIVTVLKINNDLERIGDLAVNIAERSIHITKQPYVDIPFDFRTMSHLARTMLKKSLDALVKHDILMAREVMVTDEKVDALNREMYQRVKEGIAKYPDKVDPIINYLSISRQLERIADLTTNIAEDVIYMVEGEIIRHHSTEFIERLDQEVGDEDDD